LPGWLGRERTTQIRHSKIVACTRCSTRR
jgi:hypothetical protein